MKFNPSDAMARLRAVVHQLRAPGGCPWDREQTHESLIPHLLEEAYEVAEAIGEGDPELICEELGDLLLQPILHAAIAAETGEFDLDKVAHVLTEKLIRRHPHVFGDSAAATSEAVLTQWDAIKRTEKGIAQESYLNGVGKGLPALMKAQKVQKKAARVGFDWPDPAPVIEKIREEIREIEDAMASGDPKAMKDEVGDLLFSVVNLARKLGIESEAALAGSSNKFVRRFHAMEERILEQGKKLGELSLPEMDQIWDQVKASGIANDIKDEKMPSGPVKP